MNIYLIRHGRQASNLLNDDVGLSVEGKEQANLLGQRLSNEYHFDVLYSSDYIRAVETAQILNSYLKVEHIIDKRFREVNLGDFTGLTDAQVKQKYSEFLKLRSTMTVDNKYPGGGENCEMVYKRTFEAVSEIVKKGYSNVCVVMHGAAMRALLTGIIGADYARWLVLGRQIENCSISQIYYDEDMKTYHIERFNDYAHLENRNDLLRKNYSCGFFNANKQMV